MSESPISIASGPFKFSLLRRPRVFYDSDSCCCKPLLRQVALRSAVSHHRQNVTYMTGFSVLLFFFSFLVIFSFLTAKLCRTFHRENATETYVYNEQYSLTSSQMVTDTA